MTETDNTNIACGQDLLKLYWNCQTDFNQSCSQLCAFFAASSIESEIIPKR